jgi:hypothetical protein
MHAITSLLLVMGVALMQTVNPVDPDLVRTLSTDIRGIFAVQANRFTSEQVETEFRKAVHDSKLTSDEVFMDNLMFVVRKKDITNLRPDVESVLNGIELKPPVEVSALKTLFALGGERERSMVDQQTASRLSTELKNGGENLPGPFLEAAEKIGGPKTLTVLQAGLSEATSRQEQAERSTPQNHARIEALDTLRAKLEIQSLRLSQKRSALALEPPERDGQLLKLYLRGPGPLSFWAYRELVRLSSSATPATVRGVVAQNLDSTLPAAGLKPEDRDRRKGQARLRAVVLLQDIHAQLSPEEQMLLDENRAMIRANPEAYHPDWEAVLDHN